MKTVLDEGYTWFLDRIQYRHGVLTVVVAEGFRRKGPVKLEVTEGVFLDGHPLEVTERSRRVALRFDRLVAWQCVDESFPLYDDDEQLEGDGKLHVLTRSKYLAYVSTTYPLYLDVVGPAKHYRICTEDEIIDAVAFDPPTLTLLD